MENLWPFIRSFLLREVEVLVNIIKRKICKDLLFNLHNMTSLPATCSCPHFPDYPLGYLTNNISYNYTFYSCQPTILAYFHQQPVHYLLGQILQPTLHTCTISNTRAAGVSGSNNRLGYKGEQVPA